MMTREFAGTTFYGQRPTGRAKGTEIWAAWSEDDGTIKITAYHGWGIVAEATLTGNAGRAIAPTVARDLINNIRKGSQS